MCTQTLVVQLKSFMKDAQELQHAFILDAFSMMDRPGCELPHTIGHLEKRAFIIMISGYICLSVYLYGFLVNCNANLFLEFVSVWGPKKSNSLRISFIEELPLDPFILHI